MQGLILKVLMPVIIGMMDDLLSVENLRKYGDKLFDFLEDAIADSDTKVDDTLVLPVIRMLRERLNIPDND